MLKHQTITFLEKLLCSSFSFAYFLIKAFQKQSPGGVFIKGAHRNFAKFTGKRLCQSLFFNKVGVEKRHSHRCFPVNFPKFLGTPLLKNTSGGCFCHFQTWCYEKEQNRNYSANLTTIKCGLNENKIDQW